MDRYLTGHWTLDPFAVLVAILVCWHEAGLARLARRSRPERTRQRRIRSIWFYGGLAVLLIAVMSPIDYWADGYFFVHMIQHLLLMFVAPVLIVAGAPWQPLLAGLPGHLGKDATRQVMTGRWSKPVRAAGRFLLRPWVAVISFNLAMVFWHLPGPFDVGTRNEAVHVWLVHGSFSITGVLFWLQFIPSVPLRIGFSRAGQAAALVVTNVQMWILAMSLSFLSSASWYSVYAHVPGVTFQPLADQQLGAAILWVCGDFWAVPTMIYVVRQMLAEEGDVGAAVDRILGRGSRRYQWTSRASSQKAGH
ncbi:MAG TPA: cytochrome c oxidase assembly protein [Streptosporangiaceae bacterium]|nr:cytochrome c oxidase assembly protein [Streptosporangiaceae bacterium]